MPRTAPFIATKGKAIAEAIVVVVAYKIVLPTRPAAVVYIVEDTTTYSSISSCTSISLTSSSCLEAIADTVFPSTAYSQAL